MSHGEEGFLTTKEGDKVLLDDIFSTFNNVNCPALAGKPKLFFIQSCRDGTFFCSNFKERTFYLLSFFIKDPITGPAEDLGIRMNFASNQGSTNNNDQYDNKKSQNKTSINNINKNSKFDETDGNHCEELQQQNNNSRQMKTIPSSSYHMPSLCDMLIGFPTQKGFIAYRKPEIGSWYMNAIVQVFSKHACDTDLCAMLNMVNAMISNEVTNTGKKQMSEFTSKFTKPYFHFFPGKFPFPSFTFKRDKKVNFKTIKRISV
jgi:uncharacterized protein YejL (UPF0352 family)